MQTQKGRFRCQSPRARVTASSPLRYPNDGSAQLFNPLSFRQICRPVIIRNLQCNSIPTENSTTVPAFATTRCLPTTRAVRAVVPQLEETWEESSARARSARKRPCDESPPTLSRKSRHHRYEANQHLQRKISWHCP
ncbi:hypothetical protein LOK49_LG05G01842 [Camellia lanceoleosa]|uniref:Uncharacterized protein n=1 Tax=Camellia lanceoleosa TaxID=1840588 RepID=A0ACC0HLJ1_9ERIC|nr:hypothetical protein LOK49_LG05G01842 [Camellia lanceoleosa]